MIPSPMNSPQDRVGLWTGVAMTVVAVLMIGPDMIPVTWGDNEVNYFDLAYRYVAPEVFSAEHSVFDSSDARIVSFTIIGLTVEWIGFERAKTLFGFICWALYAVGLAVLARELRASLLGFAFGLLAFLIMGQSLLGGEWMFGSVEAKVFAYGAVLFGLAAALRRRFVIAIALMALATYFHFLVGAFWALAVLMLYLLWERRPEATVLLGLSFTAAVSPLLFILVTERLNNAVDLTGLDLSLEQIYAEFRNPHHVAPFASGWKKFIRVWFIPVVQHAAVAVVFAVLHRKVWMRESSGKAAPVYLWLALLNAYVVLAMLISAADQATHALASFYLFRPASLILLLSCIAGAACVLARIEVLHVRPVAFLLVGALVINPALRLRSQAITLLQDGTEDRLTHVRTSAEADLAAWVEVNTAPGDAILLEPPRAMGSLAEGAPGRSSLERTTGRPFLVNFKFVPVAKADMAEWYRRLRGRAAFFEGDCSEGHALGADIVVFVTKEAHEDVEHCVTVVYENDAFIVARLQPIQDVTRLAEQP